MKIRVGNEIKEFNAALDKCTGVGMADGPQAVSATT